MGSDWVNAYAAWVSAIGTGIASIVVIISVFILRPTSRHASHNSKRFRAGSIRAVDQYRSVFRPNPDLKPFIYEAKSLDSSIGEDLRRKVEFAAEMMSDGMANLFHQLPNFNPDEAEAYGNFLKERYQTQPALKQFVDDNAQWYPNSFVSFLRSEMKWLINEAPAQRGARPNTPLQTDERRASM